MKTICYLNRNSTDTLHVSKKIFIKTTLCLVSFLTLISSYGQEFPPIERFVPKDYGADDQNWSISQGIDEYIYVANNKGLLEYNGARWNLYTTTNQSIIRSVAVINNLTVKLYAKKRY